MSQPVLRKVIIHGDKNHFMLVRSIVTYDQNVNYMDKPNVKQKMNKSTKPLPAGPPEEVKPWVPQPIPGRKPLLSGKAKFTIPPRGSGRFRR